MLQHITMQRIKEPNPLNFFKLREVKVPPPHYEYVHLPFRYNLETAVSKWIYANLKGKFYVGKTLNINKENKIDQVLKVGFEEEKEMSFFMLACPLLKYN